jgi:hypothetical protein
MQTQSGCEFIFPNDFETCLFMVSTRMGVLTPSGNGLYLLSHEQTPEGRTPRIAHSLSTTSLPSLHGVIRYYGTAGSAILTCKAFINNMPTVLRRLRCYRALQKPGSTKTKTGLYKNRYRALQKLFLAIRVCCPRPLPDPATSLLAMKQRAPS